MFPSYLFIKDVEVSSIHIYRSNDKYRINVHDIQKAKYDDVLNLLQSPRQVCPHNV